MATTSDASSAAPPPKRSLGDRALDTIERIGNKLPDPALLFVFALLLVWVVSALLDGHGFTVPSKDGAQARAVESQLTGKAIATFLSDMVQHLHRLPPARRRAGGHAGRRRRRAQWLHQRRAEDAGASPRGCCSRRW
jgi:hypothetical protein